MQTIDSLKINRKAISVISLHDLSGDKTYWLSRTPYQRLRVVETLRQINYGYRQSAARFQRILKIVDKKASGRYKDLDDLENLP